VAKKSMIAKAKRQPKFGVRQHNRCNRCGRPARTTGSSVCAASACARLASRGELPGVRKASW
jgi:small subunit ribosomal protein S14